MEELPLEAEACGRVLRSVRDVHEIAHERVARVLHVDADLVRAPREQLAVHERVAVVARAVLEALEHAERGDGFARRGGVAHGHARAVVRAARDGGVDHARVVRDDAVHEREVAPVHRAVADVGHEGVAGRVVLRGQHEARRVAVEAVHDAEAVVLALHVAQVVGSAAVHERVHERAVAVVGRGVAHEPRLLRQHDEVLVLEADVQVDGLAGHGAAGGLVGRLVDDRVARGHGVPFRHGCAVHAHGALLHGARGGAAARVEAAGGQKRVEALPRVVGADGMGEQARHRGPAPSPSVGAAASRARSSRRHASAMPARKIANPHVTPMSATLNTGKSMNTGSMKSTT